MRVKVRVRVRVRVRAWWEDTTDGPQTARNLRARVRARVGG